MGQILGDQVSGAEAMITDDIAAKLALLPISCPKDAAYQLARYHELLTDWNTRINLTAGMADSEAIDKLYLDSVAPLAIDGLFPKNASLIDVGSGAGFPGLPLKILRPDLNITLLDSLQKRVGFLDAVIDELSLTNIRAIHGRAEDAARNGALREQFDMATARAVAALPVLMELMLPFVRVGGRVLCYKGPQVDQELRDGMFAASKLGGGAIQTLQVSVPGRDDWAHCVLRCDKKEETVRQYPRQAGTPIKKPLCAPAQS